MSAMYLTIQLIFPQALEGGDKIVAAVRKPESLQDLSDKHRDGSLLVVKVDVSKSSEITSAFEAAQSKFGRIDVVFNNAGFPIVGEVEAFSDADIRSLFEASALDVSAFNCVLIRYL